MIENSVFCMMYWLSDPGTIEILLTGSVPHHNDTLDVPPEWYSGLLEAVAEVVSSVIPADEVEERAAMDEVRSDLARLIESSRAYFWRKSAAA